MRDEYASVFGRDYRANSRDSKVWHAWLNMRRANPSLQGSILSNYFVRRLSGLGRRGGSLFDVRSFEHRQLKAETESSKQRCRWNSSRMSWKDCYQPVKGAARTANEDTGAVPFFYYVFSRGGVRVGRWVSRSVGQ